MMDKVALKPCPFCGDEAFANIDNVAKAFVVECTNCPAEIRVTYREADLDDGDIISFDEAVQWMNTLTEQWNERA